MKSGYGLMFFFGGIDILSEMLEQSKSLDNNNDVVELGLDELKEMINKLRKNIMNEFAKISEFKMFQISLLNHHLSSFLTLLFWICGYLYRYKK